MLAQQRNHLPGVAGPERRPALARSGVRIERQAVVEHDHGVGPRPALDVEEVAQRLVKGMQAVDEGERDRSAVEHGAGIVGREEAVARFGEDARLGAERLGELRLGVDADHPRRRTRTGQRPARRDPDLDIGRGREVGVEAGQHGEVVLARHADLGEHPVRVVAVGIALERAPAGRDRLVVTPEPAERERALAVDDRGRGDLRHDAVEDRERLGPALALEMDHRQDVVGLGVVGVGGQHRPIGALGLVDASGAVMLHARV